MFLTFILLILVWAIFPIGLFLSGLSLKGYSTLKETPVWHSLLNLSAGVAAAYISVSYVSAIQGYGKGYFSRFSDLDPTKLTLTDPFEEYLAFFPWMADKIGYEADKLVHALGLSDVVIMGAPMTPGLFLLAISGVILALLSVLFLLAQFRLFGLYPWSLNEAVFYTFNAIEGVLTPVLTAAYALIFLIPTLLIIGTWLLVVVVLICAVAPLAFLYGNGFRMRLH